MPLTIETGAGVAGANSYATTEELKAYAANRGLTLPPSTKTLENALILACDKLESYRFKGSKTSTAQDLAWPRSGVYVEDAADPLDDALIPARIKMAQCQLAVESSSGTNLQPTGDGREIIVEKVDVLETKYAERGSGAVVPQFTKADAFLAPYLLNGGGFSVQTVRL
jgi:hypothetical protein